MDDALIKEWGDSASTFKNIAADLAIGIRDGRITTFPETAETAAEWDTSETTVLRASRLLVRHGVIKQDRGGYYLP